MRNFLLLALCVPFFAAIPTVSSESVTEEPIVLGATLPLSGDIASYGMLIKDGIDLAVSDLAKKGINVRIEYEDVPSPGPVALSAIQKLIAKNGINGLVANFWNPAIPIMAPAIKKAKILAFHTAEADDPILEAGDSIFSTNAKIKDESWELAYYAYHELQARTACILYIGTNFGEDYRKHFSERFSQLGGKILTSDLTKLGDSDVRPALTKVRQSSCDIFFAAYFGTNLGMLLKQSQGVGIKKTILSVYEAEDPSVISVAGSAAEDLKFFVPEPVGENETIKQFREKFMHRFGYEPRVLGSNAYDATTLLTQVLIDCKKDFDCAQSKVYEVKNYAGVSGTFTIEADGAAKKTFILKTIKNGLFVREKRNV